MAAFGFLFLNSDISLADNDDDDQYEEKYEKDDDGDDQDKKKKKKPEPVKTAPRIPQTITQVVPPAVVREISPIIPQAPKAEVPAPDLTKIYDTDVDGIADAFDTHPGEDDFIYKIQDGNLNGVADDLEFLKIN